MIKRNDVSEMIKYVKTVRGVDPAFITAAINGNISILSSIDIYNIAAGCVSYKIKTDKNYSTMYNMSFATVPTTQTFLETNQLMLRQVVECAVKEYMPIMGCSKEFKEALDSSYIVTRNFMLNIISSEDEDKFVQNVKLYENTTLLDTIVPTISFFPRNEGDMDGLYLSEITHINHVNFYSLSIMMADMASYCTYRLYNRDELVLKGKADSSFMKNFINDIVKAESTLTALMNKKELTKNPSNIFELYNIAKAAGLSHKDYIIYFVSAIVYAYLETLYFNGIIENTDNVYDYIKEILDIWKEYLKPLDIIDLDKLSFGTMVRKGASEDIAKNIFFKDDKGFFSNTADVFLFVVQYEDKTYTLSDKFISE